MKKTSVIKNYIYNLSYQVLTILLPLITVPYVSRVLGAEGIGIYSYTLSITTYFILLGSLGINLYGQKEIAYVQDDSEKRSRKFYEIMILKVITLSIAMILFYVTVASHGDYQLYYKILGLEILSNLIDLTWFFQGMEEFKKVMIRSTIIRLMGVIAIFTFVKTEADLDKYLMVYVLANFIGNFSLYFYLPKYIKKVKIKFKNVFSHLKPTIILFIPQIATQVYTVLDKTMLGYLTNNMLEVGYYEQAQKIIKTFLVIITSLGTVMLPRISSFYAHKEFDKIKEYLKKSFNYVFFLGVPIMFGIAAVANSLVPIFLGNEFVKSAILIKLMSIIVLAIGLANVIGIQFLLPVKRQKEYTLSVIVGALLNVTLNFLLIPHLLSIGAAIATVVAETCVFTIQAYYIRKDFNFKEIFKISLNYFLAGIIMFALCIIIEKVIGQSLICLLVQLIVGIIVYFSILILLKDKFLYDTIFLKIKGRKIK